MSLLARLFARSRGLLACLLDHSCLPRPHRPAWTSRGPEEAVLVKTLVLVHMAISPAAIKDIPANTALEGRTIATARGNKNGPLSGRRHCTLIARVAKSLYVDQCVSEYLQCTSSPVGFTTSTNAWPSRQLHVQFVAPQTGPRPIEGVHVAGKRILDSRTRTHHFTSNPAQGLGAKVLLRPIVHSICFVANPTFPW